MKYQAVTYFLFFLFSLSQGKAFLNKSPHLNLVKGSTQETCLSQLSKKRTKLRLPSEIDNFKQNLLVRTSFPDVLSGEFFLEPNSISWKADLNPSIIIVNLPNWQSSHSLTVKKVYLLFDPIHANYDADFELLVETEVFGSDNSSDMDFNLAFSIKLKTKDEAGLLAMRQFIDKEKEKLLRMNKLDEVGKELLNSLNNKLKYENSTETFDNLFVNFTTFKQRQNKFQNQIGNDSFFDFANYNLDLKKVFSAVGQELIAYDLAGVKKSLCKNSMSNFIYQFVKPLEITKELSSKLFNVKYDLKRRVLISSGNNGGNELLEETQIEIDKKLVFKSFSHHKYKVSNLKQHVHADYLTSKESVSSLDSFSSWREQRLSTAEKGSSRVIREPLRNPTIAADANSIFVKRQLEMMRQMYEAIDKKYKNLESKYTELKVFNDTFNSKPVVKCNITNNTNLTKPATNETHHHHYPNITNCTKTFNNKTNVTQFYQGPISFNAYQNFSFPNSFTMETPFINITKGHLPTVMRRENIAFDNGTVIIFQTIMMDITNKTNEDLNREYEKFHEKNIKSLKNTKN